MLNYMCTISDISCSRYYKYFSAITVEKHKSNGVRDLEITESILKAYNFKNCNKGTKQIKMTLNNHFGINYNLKHIRRIMKKYDIICLYRKIIKATKEHIVLPNLLDRKFK